MMYHWTILIMFIGVRKRSIYQMWMLLTNTIKNIISLRFKILTLLLIKIRNKECRL